METLLFSFDALGEMETLRFPFDAVPVAVLPEGVEVQGVGTIRQVGESSGTFAGGPVVEVGEAAVVDAVLHFHVSVEADVPEQSAVVFIYICNEIIY